jgi:Ca2+-binding RTX toxin-like protein
MSTFVSISGSGKADVTVYGNGTVMAGNGTDRIDITGQGQIVVGNGNDTLILGNGGTITEQGLTGHDTIQIGSTGTYTINEAGTATVTGAFGSATISGGTLKIIETPGQAPREIVTGGHVTIIGAASGSTGSHAHGSGGGMTHHPVTGGMNHATGGHDSLAASSGSHGYDLVRRGDRLLRPDVLGHRLMSNFVSHPANLFSEAHAVTAAMKLSDITARGNNTHIGMDGGKTTIELHGVHITDPKH